MERESLLIYRSFFEAIKELEKENQAEIWNAVFELGFYKNEVELHGISKTVFTLIKPQIEANIRKYENGKKGGKPKQDETKMKPKAKQSDNKTKGNVSVNVSVNDNVSENETDTENDNNEKKTCTPPEKILLQLWNALHTTNRVPNTSCVIGKKLFPQCTLITDTIKQSAREKVKKYGIENACASILQYGSHVMNTKPTENKYHEHRFSLQKFLKQSNGMEEFIGNITEENKTNALSFLTQNGLDK